MKPRLRSAPEQAAVTRPAPAFEPLAYSLEDAGRALGGISVKTLHRWEREGKLTMTRLGRRTVVRRSELERVLLAGEKEAA